jgi:hypothetical protein
MSITSLAPPRGILPKPFTLAQTSAGLSRLPLPAWMQELKRTSLFRLLPAAGQENCPDALNLLLYVWLRRMGVRIPEGVFADQLSKERSEQQGESAANIIRTTTRTFTLRERTCQLPKPHGRKAAAATPRAAARPGNNWAKCCARLSTAGDLPTNSANSATPATCPPCACCCPTPTARPRPAVRSQIQKKFNLR